MDNPTFTNNIDDYSIQMDTDCIGTDYDVANDYQNQLDEIIKQDTDILFE